MIKKELVHTISKNTEIPEVCTSIVLEELMSSIIKSMSSGQDVFLRGFGTFYHKNIPAVVSKGAAKKWCDCHPAKCVPAFRPSESFMSLIRNAL